MFISLKGYSISFLITDKHLERLPKRRIVDFIVHFMEEADKEISEMKISMNARGRLVATEFMQAF